MAKNNIPLTITDPNYRTHDPELEKALREHEAENLRRAEEREKELLERPSPVLDAFVNGICKIYTLVKKRKNTKKMESLKRSKSEKLK